MAIYKKNVLRMNHYYLLQDAHERVLTLKIVLFSSAIEEVCFCSIRGDQCKKKMFSLVSCTPTQSCGNIQKSQLISSPILFGFFFFQLINPLKLRTKIFRNTRRQMRVCQRNQLHYIGPFGTRNTKALTLLSITNMFYLIRD